MGEFDEVDPVLRRWSKSRVVPMHTRYREDEVRSFSIVNSSGQEFQIWIEMDPLVVNFWDFKADRRSWRIAIAHLESHLDDALALTGRDGRGAQGS